MKLILVKNGIELDDAKLLSDLQVQNDDEVGLCFKREDAAGPPRSSTPVGDRRTRGSSVHVFPLIASMSRAAVLHMLAADGIASKLATSCRRQHIFVLESEVSRVAEGESVWEEVDITDPADKATAS